MECISIYSSLDIFKWFAAIVIETFLLSHFHFHIKELLKFATCLLKSSKHTLLKKSIVKAARGCESPNLRHDHFWKCIHR
jgi:hypothetical protein